MICNQDSQSTSRVKLQYAIYIKAYVLRSRAVVVNVFCYQSIFIHRGRDKIVAISQTILSNAFTWRKMYKFILRFNWILFLSFELYYYNIAIFNYMDRLLLVYPHIHASLGLNEWTHWSERYLTETLDK